MKFVGKCAYCRDAILSFQATVEMGRRKLHLGCLHIWAKENPLPK